MAFFGFGYLVRQIHGVVVPQANRLSVLSYDRRLTDDVRKLQTEMAGPTQILGRDESITNKDTIHNERSVGWAWLVET
jgi:hypothetical protein